MSNMGLLIHRLRRLTRIIFYFLFLIEHELFNKNNLY
jgi:hypothetical protein